MPDRRRTTVVHAAVIAFGVITGFQPCRLNSPSPAHADHAQPSGLGDEFGEQGDDVETHAQAQNSGSQSTTTRLASKSTDLTKSGCTNGIIRSRSPRTTTTSLAPVLNKCGDLAQGNALGGLHVQAFQVDPVVLIGLRRRQRAAGHVDPRCRASLRRYRGPRRRGNGRPGACRCHGHARLPAWFPRRTAAHDPRLVTENGGTWLGPGLELDLAAHTKSADYPAQQDAALDIFHLLQRGPRRSVACQDQAAAAGTWSLP